MCARCSGFGAAGRDRCRMRRPPKQWRFGNKILLLLPIAMLMSL